jgi:hypothetical protein
MATSVITTPRPPLNLFEVVRVAITDAITEVYDVPEYLIPADGPNPAQTIKTAAIISNLILTNGTASAITAAISVKDAADVTHVITSGETIPASGFVSVDLDKHVLVTGDRFLIQYSTGAVGVAHLSFVLNQREQFTIII